MRFGFVAFPQLEELDLVGPWEMIRLWGKIAGGPEECLIVAEKAGPVTCAKGLLLLPHATFDQAPGFDFLLIPGGMGTRTEVNNQKLLDFVKKQAPSCNALLSVCTGSFILQAAGLLHGKEATTHWASLDRLRAFPEVRVREERFTRDGNIWCSAGVSAGMDMALAFIAATAGEEAAGQVQLAAEYFPEGKSYGQATKLPGAPGYLRT